MISAITKTLLCSLFLILLALTSCQTDLGGDRVELKTRQDSLSYAFGMMYQKGSQGFGQMGITLDGDKYLNGFNAIETEDSGFTKSMTIAILSRFSQELSIRQGRPFTPEDPLKVPIDSLSMALGAYDNYTYLSCGFEANGEAICAGIKESLTGENRITNTESEELGLGFQRSLFEAQQLDRAAKAGPNMEKGEAFLAENKTKEGVNETSSGLQYKIIKEGFGASPIGTQTVVVHYEGRLLDGTVFDSSFERGRTIDFPINQVIQGWTEGLQLMKVGAKYQFYIHPDLAYGEQGSGIDIGPNETLIFDVELIDIK